MGLEGKVVLVTGASTGIGAVSAVALAREGAQVAVNYCRSKEAAEGVVEEIERLSGRALLVQADVTKASEVDAMIDLEDVRPRRCHVAQEFARVAANVQR